MARISDKGSWDFVNKGGIYQYKEDSMIAIVEVVEDNSDDEQYSFKLRIIACNYNFPESFNVSGKKGFKGFYSGMSQFFIEPEYMPLPMGTKWPFVFDNESLSKSCFSWDNSK